ncbi:hypothetical protein M5K25_012695 [Dendrobium thyrsiflorum]|uniref:RNase H type-1 domain-containing protein n=1 Tax=Dendrobium thyrsiflorum TaxID=117978 RepID=A0ABD0V509_DENTH
MKAILAVKTFLIWLKLSLINFGLILDLKKAYGLNFCLLSIVVSIIPFCVRLRGVTLLFGKGCVTLNGTWRSIFNGVLVRVISFSGKINWMGSLSIDNILNTRSNSSILVNNFITNGRWDLDKLYNTIPVFLANQVANIRLQIDMEDRILFNKSKDGTIPTTYSILTWRVIRNFIPSDNNLIKKGLYIVSKCQCCYHTETLIHVFITGPIAMKVWLHFDAILDNNYFYSFSNILDVLHTWFVRTKGHIRNIIPVLIIWFLWKARNAAKHDGKTMEAMAIIVSIYDKVSELHMAKLLKQSCFKNAQSVAGCFGIHWEVSVPMQRIILWQKPQSGWFKLNSDGAFNGYRAGCGGLIRDHSGNVLRAFAAHIPALSPISAELYGLNLGVKMGIHLGLSNIWIEVDVMLLINYINNCSTVNAVNFYLIREIKQNLSKINYQISHILREGNTCADGLANIGCHLSNYLEFNGQLLPKRIKGLVLLDKTGLPYLRST